MSSNAGEKDLKWGRVPDEKTDTQFGNWESGGSPALHGRKTKWLFLASTFIGKSHMRSLGNSYTGEFD